MKKSSFTESKKEFLFLSKIFIYRVEEVKFFVKRLRQKRFYLNWTKTECFRNNYIYKKAILKLTCKLKCTRLSQNRMNTLMQKAECVCECAQLVSDNCLLFPKDCLYLSLSVFGNHGNKCHSNSGKSKPGWWAAERKWERMQVCACVRVWVI